MTLGSTARVYAEQRAHLDGVDVLKRGVVKARRGDWRGLLQLPRGVLEVLEGVVERVQLLCPLPGAESSGVGGQPHGFWAALGGCGKRGGRGREA